MSAKPGILAHLLATFGTWAVQFICGIVTSVMTARYLGPESFGALTYVQTLMAFAAAIVGLGLNNVLVRELVAGHEPRGAILGTILALRAGAGVIGAICVASLAAGLSADPVIRTMLWVSAGTLIFECAVLFECVLQADKNFVLAAKIKIRLVITSLLFRGVMVLAGMGVVAFVAVRYVEIPIYIAAYWWLMRGYSSFDHVEVRRPLAFEYLRQGLPLLAASLAVVVNVRIDQVMIHSMLGAAELGQYAIAVKLTEAPNFLPGILAFVLFPRMAEAAKSDPQAAERQTLMFLSAMYVIGFFAAATLSLLSRPVVHILYGERYQEAAGILGVYAWSVLFVYLQIATQTRLMASKEGSRVVLVRTVAAALANILLNLVLIPRYGLLGAAWSTIASYAIAGLFFYDRGASRNSTLLAMRAAHPAYAWQLLRALPGFLHQEKRSVP